ncbi:hypothetical protein [Candidatus Pantoea floridensis]|uniref:Uncharacterized protein n=1 Tax=Candidatus Pantoea floridensis TaxID=1938870 RepID=A0A286DR61_9GAMM|nr:hypothetical protein [Pantoea floridensis]PIF07527.1 hypothetical protein BX596_5039 [Enterobacteriaceae bacterium JKS000233]SOD61172.1 hypothetical protein SAMN06273570_5005 [Pantoea floridensis]
MPSFFNNSLSLAVLTSALILSGCSNLLPRQHKDYTGSDAATLVIQQEEVAGIVTLLYYENKGECYDRIEIYTVRPNMFDSSRRIFTLKIQPGKLLAVQQIYNTKKQFYPLGPFSTVQVIKKLPFIPQSGKRYYFAVDRGVHEIPNDYVITSNTDPQKVISEFPQPAQPSWDSTRICRHTWGNE